VTEVRSTLIRLPAGRIRVLRLTVVAGFVYPLRYTARSGPGCCTYCGCTDRFGCVSGCGWVDLAHTVCSRCFNRSMLP
jgi:hypothetical protein